MKKISILLFVLVMLFTIKRSMNANCESLAIEIYDYIVSPCVFNGDIMLKISFEYKNSLLSFYWDGELQSLPLWVEIVDSQCVNAGYLYMPES